jgi:hypothetical protein
MNPTHRRPAPEPDRTARPPAAGIIHVDGRGRFWCWSVYADCGELLAGRADYSAGLKTNIVEAEDWVRVVAAYAKAVRDRVSAARKA